MFPPGGGEGHTSPRTPGLLAWRAARMTVIRRPTLRITAFLLFDVFGIVATVAVAVTALRSTAQVDERLYDLERL